MPPAQPNQSLSDGLACLQLIAATDHPLGSREVARQLGLEHTRVNRLLGTLATLGLIEKTPQRKYQPGPGIHVLAAQSVQGSKLLAYGLPLLKSLRGDGLTVALGVLWQEQVCYLFHARPWQSFEEGIGRHELYPARQSSIGVVLQAYTLSESSDPVLAETRQRGYAQLSYTNGEVSLGVPIGVPPIAGIAVSGQQLGAQAVKELVSTLHATADAITAALHGHNTTR